MTDKELVKFVKLKIKKRETKFLTHEKNLFLHKSIFWFCLILVIFSLLTTPLIWLSEAPKYLIVTAIVFSFSGMSVMYHSKILLANPPDDEQEKDKWLWMQGRKLYFLKNLTVILVLVNIGLFLLLDYETFSKTDYFQYLPYILFAIGCELTANLFVVFIYKNPTLLLNGVFTGLGSSFKIIGVLSGSLLLFGLIIKYQNILSLLILFFLFPYFIRYVWWLLNSYKREQLNSIQESVIKFVNPNKFLSALRSELKIIKDKSEAIDLLKKLKKKKKYGVEVALLEELTILHTNKRHWVITFLIGLSIFILGAIGEGFFQDIIYEPLKNLINK